ncbi:MAG: hypothetical protein LPJ92_16120 [Rhodobacterales bacterium]|nr:hypothetical protein [Rhodobacterales bacterium]MDX5391860.1 hypothetical protein [Rhodobacterales bacterium]MDX5491560.1 hypothetical protein [Rhodobacterales bacterium]
MHSIVNESSEFIVAAPDLQVGLSKEIERGTKPKEFLNRYQSDYDVRCAFCAGHTPHRRGFTVRLEDGRIALCGIICATDFFGEEVAQRFEQILQKQINQQSKRRVLAVTVDGAAETLKILNSDWIEVENAYRAAVLGINVWLDREVLERDLSEGAITITRSRKVSVEATTRDGRVIQKKSLVEEVTGRVLGASCLLREERFFGKAKGGLVSLADNAQKPDLIIGDTIDKLMAKRRAVIELVDGGLNFARSAHQFFQEQNLAMFLKWYRGRYAGDCPVIQLSAGRRLVISHPDTQGLPTVTYLPNELPDPQRLLGLLTSRG